jgi:hypothetical protein
MPILLWNLKGHYYLYNSPTLGACAKQKLIRPMWMRMKLLIKFNVRTDTIVMSYFVRSENERLGWRRSFCRRSRTKGTHGNNLYDLLAECVLVYVVAEVDLPSG